MKWEDKLQITCNSIMWNKIWFNQNRSYTSLNAKQFQWKFHLNSIITEHKLSVMGVSNGLCNMCKKHRETLCHLFGESDKSEQIRSLNKYLTFPIILRFRK